MKDLSILVREAIDSTRIGPEFGTMGVNYEAAAKFLEKHLSVNEHTYYVYSLMTGEMILRNLSLDQARIICAVLSGRKVDFEPED